MAVARDCNGFSVRPPDARRGPDLRGAAAGSLRTVLPWSGGPAVACSFDGGWCDLHVLDADLIYVQLQM